MKPRHAKSAGVLIVAIFAVSAAAVAAESAANWTRVAAPNRTFSVETPCSDAEIDATKHVPDNVIPGVQAGPGARVLCLHDKFVLAAVDYEVADLPADSAPLFDVVLAEMAADKTAEGKPTRTKIDGRRALLNLQEKDGKVAETGFVEVNRNSIVMIVTGVQGSDNGLSGREQRGLMDRFSRSLKVAGK